MTNSNLTEEQRIQISRFAEMASGIEDMRQSIISEAHRRAEMEVHSYRLNMLAHLKKLLNQHSVGTIAKETGMARSTVYRWRERMRQEELIAEAARHGISIGGGGGKNPLLSDDPITPGFNVEIAANKFGADAEATDVGWKGAKLIPVSGEVTATDRNGDQWVLNDDGEAWNKTQDKVVNGFANWPSGAKTVFDVVRGG